MYWVRVALIILMGLTSILALAAIFVEGFSTAKLTGVLLPFLCLIYVLPHFKLVRVTFAMRPDETGWHASSMPLGT